MTQVFNTLTDAIELAKFIHRKQVDKAGLPYIEHPLRVLEKVKVQNAAHHVQIAAVLHDSTEDSKFTSDMLLELGFPESAVQIVKLLDRGLSANIYKNCGDHKLLQMRYDGTLNLSKDEYYYEAIRQNPGALMVKLADIEDNLSPWRLAYLEEATQERLKAKYAKALDILRS